MTLQEYIHIINTRFKSGISGEHSYRGDLESLIKSIVAGVEITNEPINVTTCGNPDYVITKNKIPIGYIEAKDIDKDLNSQQFSEQFVRYKRALDNLIITDYISFKFFQHSELIQEVRIAEIVNNNIKPFPENFQLFEDRIKDFCIYTGITIKSAKKLAEMMAAKARLLQNILEHAITSDEVNKENTSLKQQYDTFRNILIHDLKPKDFADIYAQTLAYGMFAARLHDPSLDNFSRKEAAELIPPTNPFLRKLFQYIAGYDIDDRIKTTVDNLADVFRATNVEAMLQNFGKSTQTEDPIIHFYETFLAEYNPKLRKSRGVFYTPQPVVNFIVRAVDDILKTEFALTQGLADTSKTKIKIKDVAKATSDLRSKTKSIEREEEVHRVQILDPATGTGTFLAEIIRQVYNKFTGQQGIWNNYVETHLLPRLNGFELLMASYAMAHLKLDLLLSDTGFKASCDQRIRVYLTNSLEEFHPDTGTLFANWLSAEANEANYIKRDTPIMCIIGNPPYSVSSSNKSVWIEELVNDYKRNLNEKNIQPLSDDYIKFIRLGQFFVEKNECGILAYISNNSFLSGIIHRQMRNCLLNSFDKIYILDLHGNAKRKEKCPDGSIDQNVFDIMQGVSINIFVKAPNKEKKGRADVFHYDLYGKRQMKYSFLNDNSLLSINWKQLKPFEPNYFLVLKDFSTSQEYENGFRIDELFILYNAGLATEYDDLAIKDTKEETEKLLNDLKVLSSKEIIARYNLNEKKITKVENAIKDICANNPIVTKIDYRPFDLKYTIYTGVSNGIMGRPRDGVMKHMLKSNLALLTCRQQTTFNFQHVFISNKISERCSVSLQTGEVNYVFPIYQYNETELQQTLVETPYRIPNFNSKIIKKISDDLGLNFIHEKEATEGTFSPVDILDYIYAVLHSATYREKYKEFLKIDFPRIPYAKDQETFWQLVKLGSALRQIHLLESPKVETYITQYPMDGDNVVRKINAVPCCDPPCRANHLRAFINDTQYFDNVPEIAWNFYIGGYQPAQKWLKDRKGRKLDYEDIQHYQKIIVALTETDRLMKEIDKIPFE